jgi:hypothetical protein
MISSNGPFEPRVRHGQSRADVRGLARRTGKNNRRMHTNGTGVRLSILDFGFWILDLGFGNSESKIQNPKSKIENPPCRRVPTTGTFAQSARRVRSVTGGIAPAIFLAGLAGRLCAFRASGKRDRYFLRPVPRLLALDGVEVRPRVRARWRAARGRIRAPCSAIPPARTGNPPCRRRLPNFPI